MVLWMMGLMAAAGAPPFTDPVAKAAVAALEKQAADWNRGDLDAFCASYAEDAIFLSPSGVRRGKAEVLAGYKKKYTSKEIMGTLSFEFLDARVAEGGKAVTVAAKWMLHRPQGTDASGLTLLSLQLKGASWMIVQDASM
jgi:ketosteroid isomerase-like protein